MQLSIYEIKKRISSMAESMESGEILFSNYEWKTSSDQNLFVSCLSSSENKLEKIKNHLDLFIDTSLNHMSIRSCFVSQSKNKSISKNEQ